MSVAEQSAEHLLVDQDVFGGDRFWAALNRLARRLGHDEHLRFLRDANEPADWYELRCVPCDQPIATMTRPARLHRIARARLTRGPMAETPPPPSESTVPCLTSRDSSRR